MATEGKLGAKFIGFMSVSNRLLLHTLTANELMRKEVTLSPEGADRKAYHKVKSMTGAELTNGLNDHWRALCERFEPGAGYSDEFQVPPSHDDNPGIATDTPTDDPDFIDPEDEVPAPSPARGIAKTDTPMPREMAVFFRAGPFDAWTLHTDRRTRAEATELFKQLDCISPQYEAFTKRIPEGANPQDELREANRRERDINQHCDWYFERIPFDFDKIAAVDIIMRGQKIPGLCMREDVIKRVNARFFDQDAEDTPIQHHPV